MSRVSTPPVAAWPPITEPEPEPEPQPRRPCHTTYDSVSDVSRNAFLMDFENDVLRYWDARKGIPRGPRRFEKQEWAALIMSQVFPHHSDVDWEEYVEWVSQGGGDEWFQEE